MLKTMQEITNHSALLQPLKNLHSYQQLLEDISVNHGAVSVTGVIESQKCHLVGSINQHLERPVFIVCENEQRAKETVADLRLFVGSKAVFYPSKDIIFYSVDVRSTEIMQSRFKVLDSLIKNENPVVVLSVEALFDRLVSKEIFTNTILSFQEGDTLPIGQLSTTLSKLGYDRLELAENPGEFAVRGGIVDVFGVSNQNAVRVEFWGDEIDSIRTFDATTQRSIKRIGQVEIFPMNELVYDDKTLQKAISRIKKDYTDQLNVLTKLGDREIVDNLKQNVGENIEKLEQNKTFPGVGRFFHYFYDDDISLLDYLPWDTILFFDEPLKIAQHAQNIWAEFNESVLNRIEKGYFLPSQADILYQYEQVLHAARPFKQVVMQSFSHTITDFEIHNEIALNVKNASSFLSRIDLLCDDLKKYIQNQFSVLILSGTRMRSERLMRELLERGILSYYLEDVHGQEVAPGTIAIAKGSLKSGYEYTDASYALISDRQLFSAEKKKKKRRKKKAALESFSDLTIGDYVVHESHGIGRYQGIEKVVVDNTARDFLKIEYASGGSLYVATNQLDMIQKYIGSDAAKPKISKLGGSDWHKSKSKARKAAEIAAKDLLAIYAARHAQKGFVYSKDTVWQREFEDTFPFEETEDQLQAIEEVKEDMESGVVMDRLVCGDVGYGKTEIAIRASFKAVQDGKQVVYLVPTTILAQQHFNTFSDRMKNYPVVVEMLSRFRTAAQQKKILADVKNGVVDILIGTHRVLSKDIEYKDLGLVIVDEEQRFGVAHKEKLKNLKSNLNFLTLTATPIPRTLHMSLTGIRDLSILEEPPEERQPIQTYVMEYNDELIKDAIHRELNRGGQVYYLYNKVSNIAEMCTKLKKRLPDANIAYAHGQMSERELENIMLDFINKELDMLVCTTIIETGLDIPNVNTIIIHDADRMGLSQLYQLRGRVGRSDKIAYAYLCYRRDKVLQEAAEKRLQTIKEFTEFGSGFKVAMRDLEIRGTGNLLGAQQHGYMESIGYEMYTKLLGEAVNRLKGEVVEEAFETSVDMNVDAYIPDFYVESEDQRLSIYKKIASIQNQQDYYDVQEEIEDRYGTIVKSVETLLQISLLKATAHRMDIIALKEKGDNIVVVFKNEARINPNAITKLIEQYKNTVLFTISQNPYLTIKKDSVAKNELPIYIKSVLQALKKLNSVEK